MGKEPRGAGLPRLQLLLLLLVVSVPLYLLWRSGWLGSLHAETISEAIYSFGPYAVLLGMAIIFVQVQVPFVPFVLAAGANVMAFGLAKGFAINYSMAVLGSICAFYIARFAGRQRVERWLSGSSRTSHMLRLMERQGIYYIFAARLIPVLPSAAVSFGAGVTGIRSADYTFGTAMGLLPIILLESYIGHDLLHLGMYKGRLIALSGVLVLLIVIGGLVKNRFSTRSIHVKK